LAFLDDDAWPREDWLKQALRHFENNTVAAVGGPAVTPADDTAREKASGRIYSSFLVSGKFRYRYLPGKLQEVDDLPSCNFLVRKSVMQELGGFNTAFWPGEDTKLCLDITGKLKKKIIYDPQLLVYHHRRPVFREHLKQIAGYALHRGYFAKRYPQTSKKIAYFLPSIFVLALLAGGILAAFIPFFKTAYIFCLSAYLLLVFLSSLSRDLPSHQNFWCEGLPLIPYVFAGIILTHITYGIYFLKGIFSKKLPEENVAGNIPAEGGAPNHPIGLGASVNHKGDCP